jgi:CHAD domain-containing protein
VTDYLLPDGMSATAASRMLAEQLNVRDGRSRVHDRAYYDTFDGLLHANGLMVVWEDGELSLAEYDSDRVRARARGQQPTRPLFASDVPDRALCDALQALIDVRALLPVTQIRSRERPLDVLDDERKTIARLRVQQPALGRRRLRGRVRVTPVRGYDQALKRVNETLGAKLGLELATRPLVDEAVVSSGGTPGGTPSKIEPELQREQRADVAAAVVLGALLDVINRNLEGTIADLDTEFLHDLRVSVRRSRAVQRELRGVFPPDQLADFRAEFRWLQQATGDVRDLDVYVLEFDSMRALLPPEVQGDLDPLLRILRTRRRAARRRMVRALRSPRAQTLLTRWAELLGTLAELPIEDRPDASPPIAAVAGGRIAKVYRQMVRMGEAIGPDSPAQDYHELRKKGKELRYLLELFGAPLYPEQVVRPAVKSLKGLQDVLGRHQDREIQVMTLRELGAEVAAGADGAAALIATGMLIDRLQAEQHAARDAFAERFAAFAAADQRRLIRDTFA